MYTEFNIPVIRAVCPETKNENNCPVREYLENNQKMFHVSMGKDFLIPRSKSSLKIALGLVKLRKICKNCESLLHKLF